ncbi:MAG: hypothetical protein J5584_00490 [Clostridia bacterium]|nr:hypothetical protein [Clostridia bacterium]
MKKRSIIALLALVLTGVMILAFSGCNNPPAGQPTAEPNATGSDPAATEPAGSSQEAADRAAKFCERFNGTWTATDNAFIDFYFDEKQPAAVFGVWGSDAAFPEGRIEDAVETAEGEYDLTVRMDPNSDTVKMHCRNENNAIFFTDAMNVTKRYEYDGTRQYPSTVIVLTPQEIMTLFGGLWTEALEGKEFLYIDTINDGQIVIKVGEWGTEGYKTAYAILRVETDSSWEKFQFTLEDADGNPGIYPGALYNAMNTMGIDFGGGEKAYNTDDYANHQGSSDPGTDPGTDPAAVEAARRRALEFAFLVDGTWNTPDGPVFVDFDIEGNEAWFMTAVWNAGGDFPSYHILDAVEQNSGEYELTVQERGVTEPVKMKCKIIGNSMELTDNTGYKKTLEYKPTKQYPTNIIDAQRSSIIYLCGGVRTEATQRMEYLNVYEDNYGHIIMNRCTWGVEGIQASFRVVKIEYTNDKATDINVILADSDYNVYDCPGHLLGADMIFHIDFGDGMHAYVEDFPENHTLTVNPNTAEKRALEFAFLVDGTWNSSDMTDFIDFEINDKNEPWFMLAVWNSGGDFPSGRIMDAVKIKDGEYDVTYKMRDESKTRTVRTKVNGNRLDFVDMDNKAATFYYDAEKQFPSSIEDIPRSQIMTYAGGVRTEANNGEMYIHVYKDDDGNIWLDRRVWGMQGIVARYRIVKIEALDKLYHELNVILVDGRYNVYQCPGRIIGAEMIFHIDFGDGMYAYLEDSFENH